MMLQHPCVPLQRLELRVIAIGLKYWLVALEKESPIITGDGFAQPSECAFSFATRRANRITCFIAADAATILKAPNAIPSPSTAAS